MRHPSESDLALYGRGDLNWFQQRLIERHAAGCDECQATIQAYAALAASLAETEKGPDVNWGRLEAEMKANIRLGLEAGECVAPVQWSPQRSVRASVAFACLALLAIACFWMQAPAGPKGMADAKTMSLESTGSGIQVREGDQVVSVLNSRAGVINTMNAQGEMRASYVDSGYVTINNVHLQ